VIELNVVLSEFCAEFATFDSGASTGRYERSNELFKYG
jgi:hypothetical protein